MALSSDFVALGPDAKCTINGIPYAVVNGRYRAAGDDVDVTDSEQTGGIGTKANKVGLVQLEIDLEAQHSTDVSPHVFPLLLTPRAYVAFALFPFGYAINFSYSTARLNIINFEGSHNVRGSEPQTIRISGKSDRTFFVAA